MLCNQFSEMREGFGKSAAFDAEARPLDTGDCARFGDARAGSNFRDNPKALLGSAAGVGGVLGAVVVLPSAGKED